MAFGLGLDFELPHGSLIVDIGAGTTDIAVISMGRIAVCDSFKVASYDIDNQIIKYIRKEYSVEVGRLTAERIKKRIGSAVERAVEIAVVAKGSNIYTGMPESLEISSSEIYEPVKEVIDSICNAIRQVLNKTDPDLVSDITNDGIYLTGGGALLNGLDEYISNYTGLRVKLLDDPSHSVVKGAAVALKKPELVKNTDYQLRSIKELVIE